MSFDLKEPARPPIHDGKFWPDQSACGHALCVFQLRPRPPAIPSLMTAIGTMRNWIRQRDAGLTLARYAPKALLRNSAVRAAELA